MDYETEARDAMTLVGIEVRASNERPDLLGALWGRFHAEGIAGQIDERLGYEAVAVYCEYEGDHTQPYTFFLGCRVEASAAVPEGFVRRAVPAGSFAHVASVGEQPGAMIQAWMAIWEAGLPRRFDVDYEIHDPTTPDRVDIYVGV